MKSIYTTGRGSKNCEGVTRRDVLQVGTLSFLGLSLPQLLRARHAIADSASPFKDKNCILLFMNGGPSHMDTWDPKPDSPAEYRGEFGAAATNVDGIRICEHLPQMAKIADKYALVRALTSPEGSHERA